MSKSMITRCLCLHALMIGLGSAGTLHADEFVSPGGGFKVDVAWKPQESLVVDASGSLTLQVIARGGADAMMLATEKFTEKRFQSVDADVFFNASETSFKASLPKSVITSKAITHRGLAGRDIRIGSPQDDVQYRVRLLFRKRIGYRMIASGSEAFVNSSKVSTFFDSFEFLKSDDEIPNDFVALADPAANFRAMMLPQARGLTTRASADSNEVLKFVVANGNRQYYAIIHQEAAGLTAQDSDRIEKLTHRAIDRVSDGDADDYRQTSVRSRTQSGIEITEHEHINDANHRQLRERRIIHNGRIYWLFVGWGEGRGDSDRAKEFLNAFRLIKK